MTDMGSLAGFELYIGYIEGSHLGDYSGARALAELSL